MEEVTGSSPVGSTREDFTIFCEVFFVLSFYSSIVLEGVVKPLPKDLTPKQIVEEILQDLRRIQAKQDLVNCGPCEHCGSKGLMLVERFCPECGLPNPKFDESIASQSDCTSTCEDHAFLKEGMKYHPKLKWCPNCGRALALF